MSLVKETGEFFFSPLFLKVQPHNPQKCMQGLQPSLREILNNDNGMRRRCLCGRAILYRIVFNAARGKAENARTTFSLLSFEAYSYLSCSANLSLARSGKLLVNVNIIGLDNSQYLCFCYARQQET
jgi:hypothetical protein